MKTFGIIASTVTMIAAAACGEGWERRAAASSTAGDWGGSTASAAASTGAGGQCGGCAIDGVSDSCRDGFDLDACGSNGNPCSACGFGETCTTGGCAASKSICVKILVDNGLVGEECLGDADCSAGSWCRSHCCDPVVATCFAINRCSPKVAQGAHCSHVNGDHECVSGVCNIDGDACS